MSIPNPSLGMPLWWSPDGDPYTKPLACIVTDIGQDSIAVNVMDSCTFNTYPKDGVRHISLTKQIPMDQLRSSGGWAYPDWLKPLLELQTPSKKDEVKK